MKQIQDFICILCVCDVRMYMDQGLYTLLHIHIYIYIYIYITTNSCTLLYFYTIILLGVSNILLSCTIRYIRMQQAVIQSAFSSRNQIMRNDTSSIQLE